MFEHIFAGSICVTTIQYCNKLSASIEWDCIRPLVDDKSNTCRLVHGNFSAVQYCDVDRKMIQMRHKTQNDNFAWRRTANGTLYDKFYRSS